MSEDKKFKAVERLRTPERVSLLEIDQVVAACLAHLSQPTKVLDVGTGSGLFAQAFVERGLEVDAIDENPLMLEAASQYVPTIRLKQAQAEVLPYPDETFDLVFLGLVFHEVDDPEAVLAETRRVTRARAGLLEWNYREETIGPPLVHRVQSQVISTLAQKSGFSSFRAEPVGNLILYILDV